MEFNDSLLDNERAMSLKDKRALNIMESTAVLKEGHYETAMPWRYSSLCQQNNRILAVQRLELHSLRDNERVMSLKDKRALNIMESTAVLKEGHYHIAMPWRYSSLCLPNNRILAIHHLELL